jgi:hypothetical protein
MEKLIWAGMALIMISGGTFMTFWPGAAAVMNRDREEGDQPPTAGEIFQMRLGGVILLVGGAAAFYAIVTGMPGAVDPVLF